jgi:hypothetical protein
MPRLEDVLEALRDLYEETQDWEDALGEERSSLVEVRARVAAILKVGGE